MFLALHSFRLKTVILVGVSFVLLFLGRPAQAELAPAVYEQMQQQAPEYLRVEVLRVRTSRTVYRDFVDVAVTVDARVGAVERSATGLRPGQRIRIQYERREHKYPLAGPSAVPLLEAGKFYPAFLEREGNARFFRPAAGGYSFQVIPSKGKKQG
jgi:hypothetical protein